MIRQAISCDICGAEKKQTNHWFVVHAHAGELRVSGWTAQGKLRTGSKHLCGQTCLHKLLDEFIAGNMTNRVPAPVPDGMQIEEPIGSSDFSLISSAAHASATSTVRALPAASFPTRTSSVIPAAVIAIAAPRPVDEPRPVSPAALVDDAPNYASRHWRAEAWERERERERRSGIAVRRKSS
jgi:hypothetical protein